MRRFQAPPPGERDFTSVTHVPGQGYLFRVWTRRRGWVASGIRQDEDQARNEARRVLKYEWEKQARVS